MSTYDSFPYASPWAFFPLKNGSLYPYNDDQSSLIAAGLTVSAGHQVPIELAEDGAPNPVETGYRIVAPDDPCGGGNQNILLAVHGEVDNFSMCLNVPFGSGPLQNTVVYNASDANSSKYDSSTFYPIILQVGSVPGVFASRPV